MKVKPKPKKQYTVNVDMKYSEEYHVTAKTKAEAKQKAWAKFTRRVPKRIFDISADEA